MSEAASSTTSEAVLAPAAAPATAFGVSHRAFVTRAQDPERLTAWKAFTEDFWRVPGVRVPPEKVSFLFRRGFLRDKWTLYDLGRNDVEQYLSDLQLRLLYRANTIYSHVLENRLMLLQAIRQSFRVPEVYWLRDPEEGEVIFSAEWEAAMRADGDAPAVKAFAQPLNASAVGKSAVFRLHKGAFDGAGKTGSSARLRSTVRDWARGARSPYLLTEFLEQGGFGREVFPNAANTVHVMLCRDEETWLPYIAGAVLRVGTKASAPLSDIEQGGMSAWIEPETGRITRCVAFRPKEGVYEAELHPDTGRQLKGEIVPGWIELRDRLLRFFDQSSYLRVAGFDFLLQDDGFACLGATNTPDVAAIQVHKPLLEDARVAEFLRKQKI